MKAAGQIARVSLGMNSNIVRGPGREFALPPSLTEGKPAEIVRLLRGATAAGGGPCLIDEALLAGGWTLLSQEGMPSLLECQRLGVDVAVAGIFATGLLTSEPNRDAIGMPLFAYQAAPAEMVQRAAEWRRLASEHHLSLPAVAIAFAWLPTCVTRVVIGCATAEEVRLNAQAVRESATVPAALWHAARARGLLSAQVPLPPLSASAAPKRPLHAASTSSTKRGKRRAP